MIRTLLLILLTFMAGGCWTGADFYRGEASLSPIAPGFYRFEGGSAYPPFDLRVQLLPDGLTRFSPVGEDGEDVVMAFAPLPGREDTYIGRVTRIGPDISTDDLTIYIGARPEADGTTTLLWPHCEVTAALARRHGADLEDPVTCHFQSKPQLEAAFREFEPTPESRARLIPATASDDAKATER